MIGIAVLGCGRTGAMHAANIKVAEMHPPTIVGFDDGARALALAEAALKSIAECRAVKVFGG
jgi:predicted dehydrogenase